MNSIIAFVNTNSAEIVIGIACMVLPFAIAFAFSLVRYGVRQWHPNTILVGQWYIYHYSTQYGKRIFRKEEWRVSPGFRDRLRIRTSDSERPDLVYIGTLEAVEGSNLLATLHGARHEEVFQVRILTPIPSRRGITFGLKTGIDFDSHIFCTVYLFSRQELKNEDAIELLDTKMRGALPKSVFRLGWI